MPSVTWVNIPASYTGDMTTEEGTDGQSSILISRFPIGPLYLNESREHVFTCLTSNSYAGKEYSKAQDVTVVVGFPVEWQNGTWPVVETKETESAVLMCEFSGTPTPAVSWKRNGVNLPIVKSDGSFNHVVRGG